ncbi:nuclear transport factor 2 family protein [Leifsonia shinshuensis]|uniref:Nuclear transport factor 2 family protein n=1 Tax=Leifsonia shinshuensis TaxID=150026 RepID=A0A7G6YA89_9MICO|nr:nuclear transport factor 2 family protein [Leifsonia shinshuensis]QNE35404.1 nuclear transport factor 2 family protein [Leifsonia shinshuensis]
MSAEDVTAVVAAYVRAVSTADVPLLQSTFRDDARMWGYLGDQFVSAPIQEFFGVVDATSADLDWVSGYVTRISVVRIAGRTATAVLEEAGYAGSSFVNLFTLVHEDEGWRIATKTFTTVEEGVR